MSSPLVVRLGMTLASGLAMMCAVRADEAPKPPAIVQRVIAAYEANVRGVIGMQRHFSTLIDAGVAKHTEVSDSAILFKDGTFLDLRYYRVIEDGKEFTDAQLSDRDQQALQGWSAGKVFFKEPYDVRFAGDYTFASAACPDCAPGTVTVKFESLTHDEQHGAGTMWIDTSNEHVLKLTYAPYVLPPHATSGSITETSGQALANLWYVVRIDETYQGHMLLLHGSGTFTGLFDHFERFRSAGEGANALRAGTLVTTKS